MKEFDTIQGFKPKNGMTYSTSEPIVFRIHIDDVPAHHEIPYRHLANLGVTAILIGIMLFVYAYK